MSRYRIPTRDAQDVGREATPPPPATEAVVGWDAALATFFAQVGPAPLDQADEAELALWVGGRHGEITTPRALAACIARYAEVPPAVMQALAADQRNQPARPASRLLVALSAAQPGPGEGLAEQTQEPTQAHVHKEKEEEMPTLTRCVEVYLNEEFLDPSVYLDGYHPGQRMRLAISYESALGEDLDVCEEAFELFNVGDQPEYGPNPIALRYYAAGNRSLCIGDVVVVDGSAYGCESTSFSEAVGFEAPAHTGDPDEDPCADCGKVGPSCRCCQNCGAPHGRGTYGHWSRCAPFLDPRPEGEEQSQESENRAYRCDPTGSSRAAGLEPPPAGDEPGLPQAGGPVGPGPDTLAPPAHGRRRGWEVFDPRDGRPIRRLRFRWMAALVARLIRGDYARPWEGW